MQAQYNTYRIFIERMYIFPDFKDFALDGGQLALPVLCPEGLVHHAIVKGGKNDSRVETQSNSSVDRPRARESLWVRTINER